MLRALRGRCAAIALAALIAGLPGAPRASVLDTPIFNILGLVIVWGADSTGTTAPVAGDFVLMLNSGGVGTDLIGADVRPVLTGTLNPIPTTATWNEGELMSLTNATPANGNFVDNGTAGYLDAADSFDAFALTAATDVTKASSTQQHSFYVASNTAFNIAATASLATATGDFSTLGLANISLDMAITTAGTDGGLAFGAAAQSPGTGAGNPVTGVGLDALGGLVYTGAQRTAAAPGSIVEQSVRFDNTYSLTTGAGNYDLSDGVGTLAADVTYTIYVP